MKITKAIIAAGGYGTRFLPATKVIPKEMLPLVDRPIIQYLVEEAVASGIREVILVTRANTSTIRDHFSSKVAVEKHLRKQGKKETLLSLKKIGKLAKITFVEQDPKLPYGTGAALVSAADKIKKGEYFVFMYGDDLYKAKIPATKQMINLWQKDKKAVILACREVAECEINRYGIVALKKGSQNEVVDLIEKPKPEEAPSRLGNFGRFILNREIIEILFDLKTRLPKGREFLLADAIGLYAKNNHKTLAIKIDGVGLTTGDPLNWLKATLEYAWERPELKEELKSYLKKLLQS